LPINKLALISERQDCALRFRLKLAVLATDALARDVSPLPSVDRLSEWRSSSSV
jgi:hypothetical protein